MDIDGIRRGIIPGLISGYLFLAYAGPAIQDMNGGMLSADSLVGFVLHTVISIVIGDLYTGVFMRYVDWGSPPLNILIGGSIYGLIWWIIGVNIIVPVLTGGQVLQLSIGPSFYGHIIFGHTLAFLVILQEAVYLAHDYKYLPKSEHPAGFIYNISDPISGLVKIGRTINPKQRMQKLQSEHGKQLRYSSLMKSDNAPKDERRLHKKYASRRKDGEWFDMSEE